MSTSEAVTHGVRVTVRSTHVPERSDPESGEWFFAYTVTISNEGDETVQLVSRHWIIADADGREQEVRGPGVVGEQPVLAPGESFEYTSACPLGTACGSMRGTYQMVTEGGDRFDATIAPFSLAAPYALH
ncbi:MAG TPA: Co2+/Mg2+ efflux protein ApaG [Myxococcota bacterium]|jgi:ApaG protein|nr:Co2+/Mg2+ efflux protein ApaG [Myxococcota bacterium]